MFGFLKIFKRKAAETPAYDESYLAAESEPFSEPEPERQPLPQPMRPQPRGNLPQQQGQQNGRGVQLPLQIVLAGLPLELQPRVRMPDVGDAVISIPLEKILSQLSRGSVKITFGELRQAAPEVFAPANDRDRVLVPLPLSEILSRLNPALITRRRVQKQIEIPEEISSPFDPEHQGAIFSIGPGKGKPEPAPAPASRAPAPPPAPAVPAAPVRSAMTSSPTPPPPTAMPPAAPALMPGARSMRELNPTPPPPAAVTPVPPPPPAKPAPTLSPAPQIPFSIPAAPAVPVGPITPLAPAAPAAVPAASAPAPAKPSAAASAAPLLVALTSLAEAWPEAVRQEIVHLNLVEAKVHLPTDVVERALKQGRIAFSWKLLRGWIKPTPVSVVSAQDAAVLELPLKVVAPLFIARQKEASKEQQQVSIDENIPNLFFGFPQADPAGTTVAAATATPADTNYYVWDDSSDTVRVSEAEVKRGTTPGTNFVAKYATPNEVVSRASGLDGVAGALIALPDGLMVASRLSPDLNGDTLAAFLPQIFGKVSQCTKELRMGDLNNLNFTVGNVPWKIFRVNAIFFAAFGKAGEPLPTAQLAALAGELDHKPK